MKKGWKQIIAGTPVEKAYAQYRKVRAATTKTALKAEMQCVHACLQIINGAANTKEAADAFKLIVSLSWVVPDMYDALDLWASRCSTVEEAHELYMASRHWRSWQNSAKARWEELSQTLTQQDMSSEVIWSLIDQWVNGDAREMYSCAEEQAWKYLVNRCKTLEELLELEEKANKEPYCVYIKPSPHSFKTPIYQRAYEKLYPELYKRKHGEYPRYFSFI